MTDRTRLLTCVRPGGKYHAPTWRVRCVGCYSEYLRTGWAEAVKRSGCNDCKSRRQRKPRG